MEGYRLTIRLVAMALLVTALAFVMGGRLISLQLTDMPDTSAVNTRTTSRTVTLPAARGNIYDCNGRTLVDNRLSYNITIDRARLFKAGKASVTVLELIRAAGACGIAYTDELLPVTLPPFAYTEMTPEQEKYFKHYLEKKGLPEDITAPELMDRLFDDYGMTEGKKLKGVQGLINGFSPYEARLAAGVLYEIDLRYQAAVVDKKQNLSYMYIPAYTFASDVSMELISRISENRYPGAEIVPVTARRYHTAAAAHILGRVGQMQGDIEQYTELGYKLDELVGLDGAEKAFESYLHGVAGEQIIETDSEGRVVNVTTVRAPQAGQNVYLTIDIRLQEELERMVREGVLELSATGEELRGREAEAAAAVITDIHTGEVLAAANYPTYDLNTFSQDYATLLDDPLNPLYNRAVDGTYAPGSTFKMVTAAAALESGTVKTNTKIFDEVVYSYYTTTQPRCNGSHGSVNISEALKVSCNYFFYDVGRLAGIDQIVSWAKRFGLGLPTGFELEDSNKTALGRIAGPESSAELGDIWYPGNTLSAAIGQHNNAFTPIQLANYVASIANGGTLYKAHLLKEVLSYDFSYEYYVSQPEVLREVGLSDVNLAAIQQGMFMVTQQGGTAYNVFKDFPYAVAGKTGSVQAGDKPNNAVFVCYAPYDDPQIALSLVVEKGGAGSVVAPLARDILGMWFRLQSDMANVPAEGGLVR